MLYAEKLHRRFSAVTKLPTAHYCITDRPHEIDGWATPITPFKKATSWWNKVNLFSPDMPSGPCLYMDLDIVILQNFDIEIEAMLNQLPVMSCVSDTINWMGYKFSSSMMVFEAAKHAEIFEKFLKHDDRLYNRAGGDQVWVGPQLEDIIYIDEVFPDLKKNLKYDLMDFQYTPPLLPTDIDNKVKLVDCGGDPKQHILEAVPYIKKNWHDVQTVKEKNITNKPKHIIIVGMSRAGTSLIYSLMANALKDYYFFKKETPALTIKPMQNTLSKRPLDFM